MIDQEPLDYTDDRDLAMADSEALPHYVPEAEVIRHLVEDEGHTGAEAVEALNWVYAKWAGQVLLTGEQWEVELMEWADQRDKEN